jgi:hypothetical protein
MAPVSVIVLGYDGLRATSQRWSDLTGTLGWLLNAAAIMANGHMAAPAAVLAGHHSSVNTWIGPHLAAHSARDANTRLPWLSDALVVHVPGYLISISLGDIILAAGVALFLVQAMRGADHASHKKLVSRWTARP